MTKVISWLV